MALKQKTPPNIAFPAVSTAEAKLHLRIDNTDEDSLIASLVLAATNEAEHLMGRAIMPQEWQLTLDSFFDPTLYSEPVPITVDLIRGPSFYNGTSALRLQRPTVTGITSVKYNQASDGVLTTLAPTEYQLANASAYTARLVPAYGKSWPAVRPQPECVQVVFACGYLDATVVPESIKAWIKLRVGALYENKESWTLGKPLFRNEFLDCLLDRGRATTF